MLMENLTTFVHNIYHACFHHHQIAHSHKYVEHYILLGIISNVDRIKNRMCGS